MIPSVTYLIPFLLSLVASANVIFYYNKIATSSEIGMDCRVVDPEERILIKIHQGSREMISMTTGCVMKSNDSRLSISCVETERFLLLSVNFTGYASSDLGTWNCSNGNSSATLIFQDYIQRPLFDVLPITFKCIASESCNISIYLRRILFPRDYVVRKTDGTDVLRLMFDDIEVFDAYRGRIAFTENNTFRPLKFTFLEVKLSDTGIYYLLFDEHIAVFAFTIQVQDKPALPLISSSKNLNLNTDQGLTELTCFSESRTQPVFLRNYLSYRWKVDGLDLTNVHTCFWSKGPVFRLFFKSCCLEMNASISVTCTVEEDGLMSNKSEPFILRLETPLVPNKLDNTPDSMSIEYKGSHIIGHSTGILIGACLGCLVGGSVLTIFLTLVIIRRTALFKKGQKGSGHSGNHNETFYMNTVVDSERRTTEIQSTREYDVLEQNRMEGPGSQYTVILSKDSGHMNEPEMYDNA